MVRFRKTANEGRRYHGSAMLMRGKSLGLRAKDRSSISFMILIWWNSSLPGRCS
jgi:hypothetical protein